MDVGNETQPPQRSTGRKIFRWIGWRLIFPAALLYIVLLGLLIISETSLIYPGARDGNWEPQGIEYKPISFNSADGTKLLGWYLAADPEQPDMSPKLAMLMHHGNGENITHLLQEADRFRDRYTMAVFLYDNRGFGRSEGSPDELGVLADGEAAMNLLMEQTELTSERIVQFGRSLGGGVAVHVAAKYQAAGLLLDRTFNSIVDVAAARYWMFPVRWVIRNRFLSQEKIADYHGPLLQLHGDADEIIDLRFAKQLFDAAASKEKIFIESPGTTHLDPWPAAFRTAADTFFAEIKSDLARDDIVDPNLQSVAQ